MLRLGFRRRLRCEHKFRFEFVRRLDEFSVLQLDAFARNRLPDAFREFPRAHQNSGDRVAGRFE